MAEEKVTAISNLDADKQITNEFGIFGGVVRRQQGEHTVTLTASGTTYKIARIPKHARLSHKSNIRVTGNAVTSTTIAVGTAASPGLFVAATAIAADPTELVFSQYTTKDALTAETDIILTTSVNSLTVGTKISYEVDYVENT